MLPPPLIYNINIRAKHPIRYIQKPACLYVVVVLPKRITVNSCQTQPSRGVFRKRCSENMQQIYRRTLMPKCSFNKIASNFIEIALRHRYSPENLLHIFRTAFLKNTSGWLLLSCSAVSTFSLS